MDFDEPALAFGKFFSCEKQRIIPRGQDTAILPAQVANHSVVFG